MATFSLRKPGMARDITPPLVGAGLAVATVLGLRASLTLDPGNKTQQNLFLWAPALGAVVSLLGAAGIYAMGGTGPAVSTAVSGGVASLAMFLQDMLFGKKAAAVAVVTTQYAANPASNAMQGLAAVVPEWSNKLAGIIFAERVNGVDGLGRNLQKQGTTVRLNGDGQPGVGPTGAIPSSAFGKKAFATS